MKPFRFAAFACSIAVAGSWMACAAYEDQLIVRRTRGQVWLEAKREGRLVTKQREELTLSDCRVIDVTGADEGGGEEIWRITTVDGRAALAGVRYGQTPAGYAQVTPPSGRAPDLRAGGEYRAECLGRSWLVAPFRVPAAASGKR